MYEQLIDFHCHILPRIDDGPRNMSQAIRLAQLAQADGIGTVIATPHFYESKARGLMSRRLDAISSFRSALAEREILLEVLPGFEVHATHSLLNRRSFGALTMAGTHWIMLEMPYIYGDEFETVFDACLEHGLRPLIAHPERYPYFTTNFTALERMVSLGAWAQVTAAAVAGRTNEEEQHWCLRALDMGLAHIVASDMHNTGKQAPQMQAAIAVLQKQLGDERTYEIMHLNPARLLGRRL